MAKAAGDPAAEQAFPPLPLEAWEDSKETLHRYAQVVGKIRLRYALHSGTTGGTLRSTVHQPDSKQRSHAARHRKHARHLSEPHEGDHERQDGDE